MICEFCGKEKETVKPLHFGVGVGGRHDSNVCDDCEKRFCGTLHDLLAEMIRPIPKKNQD